MVICTKWLIFIEKYPTIDFDFVGAEKQNFFLIMNNRCYYFKGLNI